MENRTTYKNPSVAVRILNRSPLNVRFFAETQYTDLCCVSARFLRTFFDIEASEASRMVERRIKVTRYGHTVFIHSDDIDEYKKFGVDPAEYLPLV